MSSLETPPRCEDLDLDALAYGELEPSDELWARSHIALCQPCHQAHDQLVAERRSFTARARAARPAPLPSFDGLLLRAEREPVRYETRWQEVLRSWAAPFRGAVLQGAVGMFAIGMLVQVAILRPPRATETVRPRSVAGAAEGGTSAALDPWGVSIADCGPEAEVCEQALAKSSLHAASAPSDPCAGVSSQSTFMTSEWSQQSPGGLADGDGVCAPDAI